MFSDQIVCVTVYNLGAETVRTGDHLLVGAPQLCVDKVSIGPEVSECGECVCSDAGDI